MWERLPEETVQRFMRLEKDLAAGHGRFALFGIFQRENSSGYWDVVASAPWIEASPGDARKLFARLLSAELTPGELTLLSQIAFITPKGPHYDAAMRRIERAVYAAFGSPEVEHGLVEMRDVDLFGQTIDHAYIITAQSLNVPVLA